MEQSNTGAKNPFVSVLMPTYGQAAFISRAVESLIDQTLSDWELVIVNDGSIDGTPTVVEPYLADARIRYYRFDENQGLGTALNYALQLAKAPLVAYLPSDDVYYRDHLASLAAALDAHKEAILAYAGVWHEHRVPGKGVLSSKTSCEQMDGHALQLVQVMHRRTNERWVEREELVTDDLERMFWHKLRNSGTFVSTNHISCQWVDHPDQWHKVIQEPAGGINPYRSRYHVRQPLHFHATTGHRINEVEHYRRFREREDTPPAPDGLKILLVGELAFNPERVLALEERGHRLFGLWTSAVHWFNTVGPLPFGHVEDLPRVGWPEAIKRLKPDIIYALLNWNTVPFAHEVLISCPDIPFVWHFKEGPFDCIANGTWSQLIDLYTHSDGQIYLNAEIRDWFSAVSPSIVDDGSSLVLDGDLPKSDWFSSNWSPRLSEVDGGIHTVVPGGPNTIRPSLLGELAHMDIHTHLYGDFYQGWYHSWVEEAQRLAGPHLHLHPQVEQEHWVSELSKYDAGWLHQHHSVNEGDLRRANWGDLNYPARIATLASAGVPMIQYDNIGSIVATQSLTRKLDIGIFYKDAKQLGEQLYDKEGITHLQSNVRSQRDKFTFDFYADTLIDFFRQVIAQARATP
jgi:hypothetical protein